MRHRIPVAGSVGALLATVGLLAVVEAGTWIGRPFPGFLVLANRVVASAALPAWPASRGGLLFQHEVAAVDGEPVRDGTALRARVEARPPGTTFAYTLRRDARILERRIESRRFGAGDFAWLFGAYFLNGAVLGACGVAILARRRGRDAACSAVPLLLVGSLWGFTAMDLYGPYRFFRLHALCEALLPAAAFHFAWGFPSPLGSATARRRAVAAGYLAALALAGVYEVVLFRPVAYTAVHLAATSALGLSLVAVIAAQGARVLRPGPAHARGQLRILAWGAVLALSPIAILTLADGLTGGRAAQNAVGFTAFWFALAIGHAALRGPAADRRPAEG